MNQAPRIATLLRILTAIFLLVAAAAFLWRPSLTIAEIPPAGLDTAPNHVAAGVIGDQGVSKVIVSANIFSATRAAPAARYTPYMSDATNTGASTAVTAVNTTSTSDESVPRLYGTLADARGPTALLRLDPKVPGSRVYHEGERGGAYTVAKITERSVVLSGPRGRIVLYLNRTEGQTP